jgi:hypothetical protein
MSFQCPQCEQHFVLHVTDRIELPPDSRSDEISLQIVKCQTCGFSALAVFEESRRGALFPGTVNHTGYHVADAVLQQVSALLRACPDPRNPQCNCDSHRTLRIQNASGRWAWLDQVKLGEPFELVWSG